MNRLLFFSLFLFAAVLIAAQWGNPMETEASSFQSDANRFYSESMKILESVPGASVVVVKDGKTVFEKGFGMANIKEKAAFTKETNFYIASCTKAFTALMAAQLDVEGLLSLDDKLIDHFPEISFHDDLEMKKIRLRDLMTHTSGLENGPISFRSAYSGEHSLQKLIELLKVSEPNKAGYGNFQYTNTGYNIYTLVVEKVLGRPWQDVLAEKVFAPAGMDRTTAYMSKAEKHQWEVALPYAGVGKEEIREVYLTKKDNTMQSAGGLITTTSDLGRWLNLQIGLGKLEGRQLFAKELIKNTQTILASNDDPRKPFPSEGYGMGWHVGAYEGQKVVWHYGGFPGAMTHISFMPESGTGVAVFVNDAVAGYRVMNLFANFAYDYLLEGKQVLAGYQEEVQGLKSSLNKRISKVKEGEDNRKKRTWQLSKSFPFYSGTYVNDLYGTIQIKGEAKKLKAKMGNMHCIATPFTKSETIRVELVPFRGEVIEFIFEEEELVGLKSDGTYFSKVK